MRYRILFRWQLLFILLVGAAFRLVLANTHGLDADELYSLNMAHMSATFIVSHFVDTLTGVHPKLYYLILHFWILPAGISEFALRLPNILFDLVLGAVVVQTAQSGFSRRSALITGVLWCCNPLLISIDSYVRMYSILALFATLTFVLAVRALKGRRRLWWAAFALAALGAGYVHTAGLIVLVSAGVLVGIGSVSRRHLDGLVALALVGIGYLPYLIALRGQSVVERHLGNVPSNLSDFFLQYASTLIADRPPLPNGVLWVLLAICVALIVCAGVRSRRGWALSVIALLAVVTVEIAYLALRQSIFDGRYMAYAVPLVVLLISLGISRIPVTVLPAGLVVGFIAAGLWGLVIQSKPEAHDDFRSAARFLDSYADRSDLIITMGDFALSPTLYYYHGDTSVVAPWHDAVRGSFRPKLDPLLPGHDTVWIVLYQTNVVDPNNRFDNYFRARYPVRTEVFPSGVTVRGYDLRPMTVQLPPEATPVNVIFAGRLALRGYQLNASALSAHDDRLHPPSGWAHMTLYWEALQPAVDFAPQVQIEDSIGQVWGINLTRPNDIFSLHSSSTWLPGQIWRSDSDVNLNPATPPGQYNLILRVSAPGTDQFWANENGETAALISPLTIIP